MSAAASVVGKAVAVAVAVASWPLLLAVVMLFAAMAALRAKWRELNDGDQWAREQLAREARQAARLEAARQARRRL